MTRLEQSVAASVDAPPALLPHLDQLFKGLPSLGSSPRLVARLLAAHGLHRRARLLDLACGKGAAALTAAATIGCRVHGVDGYQPFIDRARRAAARRGMSDLVTFEVADLEAWRPGREYDAAMMLGLWPLATAARSLRACVRPRALYIVDDVFYDPPRGRVPRGLRPPPTLAQSHAVFTRLGDSVAHVEVPQPARVHALNQRLFLRIQHNASQLARENPRLRPAVRAFLRRQQAANHLLGTSFRPALWVVRKGRATGSPARSIVSKISEN